MEQGERKIEEKGSELSFSFCTSCWNLELSSRKSQQAIRQIGDNFPRRAVCSKRVSDSFPNDFQTVLHALYGSSPRAKDPTRPKASDISHTELGFGP